MKTLVLKNKASGEETTLNVPAQDEVSALIMWQTFETFREMRKMFTVIPWRIS